MKHFCKCGARLTDIVELMHYVCPDCYEPEEEISDQDTEVNEDV